MHIKKGKMIKKNVAVIGLGEIGLNVLKNVVKKKDIFNVIGIDKDESKFNKSLPVEFFTALVSADIFIICVYTSKEVIEVVNNIDYSNNPLLLIESTIHPEICKGIEEKIANSNNSFLAYFPHRYNKNDRFHQIFNHKRVLGPINEGSKKSSLDFLSNFMEDKNIILTHPKIAILSKLVENSYRYVEISLAEEIALFCLQEKISFKELRRCINSKWNINIKEAKTGINQGCLPKDISLFNDLFKNNLLFNRSIKLNDIYKQKIRNKK
jgi:UDP-N-acetyl-D-mannosaminuronate dehydrogenase